MLVRASLTQVGDELLGRVHILQELLEELVSEPLLQGGRVLVLVLQSSTEPSGYMEVTLTTMYYTHTHTHTDTDTHMYKHRHPPCESVSVEQ